MPDTPTSPTDAAVSHLVCHVRGGSVEVELRAVDTDADVAGAARELGALIESSAREGVAIRLAADHPADDLDLRPEAVADAVGLSERRDLLQMRRPLPVEADHPTRIGGRAVVTRPFVPGADEGAWLRVNNRAFADHADQGREDRSTLAARMAEPWFDAADFLVADEVDPELAGELSGFCWTKVHPPSGDEPRRLGEIYVIGVDPRHRGEGLGPAFVLSGLDHLAGRGIDTALLYVDADNEPARRLYDRLGFTVHRRRRVYTSPTAPVPGPEAGV